VPADVFDIDDDGDVAERIPFDLDGQLRFYDMFPAGGSGVADPPDYPAIVDMGAYEYQPWPKVVSAQSVKTHGSAGDFAINVLDRTDNLDIECRQYGVTRLDVVFDVDIQRINNNLTDVAISSGTVTTIGPHPLPSGMIIEMTGATNAEPLTVSFPGIAYVNDINYVVQDTLCIRQLVGDVRPDLSINAIDRVDVRDMFGQQVDASNFRADVRADGTINAIDRIDVRIETHPWPGVGLLHNKSLCATNKDKRAGQASTRLVAQPRWGFFYHPWNTGAHALENPGAWGRAPVNPQILLRRQNLNRIFEGCRTSTAR